MDRAQTRWLIGLVAVAAALGGVLWWQGRPTVAEDDEASAVVWSVSADDVARVRVERAQGELVLERREGAWHVGAPGAGGELEWSLAEPRRADELVRGLAGLERAIPVAAAAKAPFGLAEPPEARVTWTRTDGSTSALDVGIRAPAAYRVYVRTADGGVGAASGDPTGILQAAADTFRDKRLFSFDPAQVRGVRLELDGHALEVRGEGRTWHLVGFGRADADRVDDLVVDLLDLRFDREVVGVAVEPADATVEVTLADGSVETVVLGVGDGAQIPARAPDGRAGHVFAAARGILGRGPTDLGQQTAFALRPQVADRVVAEGLGRRFEARHEEAGWLAPPTAPDAVYDAVLALASLPVVRSLDPVPSDTPSLPPEVTVTVHEPPVTPDGEPLVVRWLVGPALPDGTRVVRDADGPGPGVRVRSEALEAVLRGLP